MTTSEERRALLEATRCFFGEVRPSAMGGSPGHSGGLLARVETPSGRWMLRGWPEGFGRERLGFVHRALLSSREGGFGGVPKLARTERGETILRVSGRLYDAQEWAPGRPLSPQRPGGGPVPNLAVGVPGRRLRSVSVALARLHLSTSRRSLGPGPEVGGLAERLGDLARATEGSVGALREGARRREQGVDRTAALRWLGWLPRAVRVAREAALLLPDDRSSWVLCHGDVWPAHAFFDGDEFVRFADFESLAYAPPGFDLAQLVAHFGGWDRRGEALRSYGEVRELAEHEKAALAPEVVADLAGEALWSLSALYGDAPRAATHAWASAHAHNLRALLGPLQGACGEIEASGA